MDGRSGVCVMEIEPCEATLKGMEALMHETQQNPKRIGGSSLLMLAAYARRRARETSRAATVESVPFPRPTPGSAERISVEPISAPEMGTDEQLSGQVEGNVIAFPDPSALDDGMRHAMGSG